LQDLASRVRLKADGSVLIQTEECGHMDLQLQVHIECHALAEQVLLEVAVGADLYDQIK